MSLTPAELSFVDSLYNTLSRQIAPPISPISALPDQAIDGSQQHKATCSVEVFNSVPLVSQFDEE